MTETKLLPGLSTSIQDMSVPLEVTHNSNKYSGHDDWDNIGGDVDVYIWRCKLVVRLSCLMVASIHRSRDKCPGLHQTKEHPTPGLSLVSQLGAAASNVRKEFKAAITKRCLSELHLIG